jgi:hypothetical protein
MSQSHFPSHPKTRGEIAEALFIAKALSLGFIVSKPFGDNAPYDFILGYRKRLFRVQIKSAWTCSNGGYQFVSGRLHGKVRPYRCGELDFIIAYLAPDVRRGSGRQRPERRPQRPQALDLRNLETRNLETSATVPRPTPPARLGSQLRPCHRAVTCP